mmetsp:Transcript_50427/g.60672  ORF Transcript_50427/g.60672 Transcript_50427/m.60672 type:complete len:95 (-) Transcript_50427:962-1246(-)
MIASHMRKHHQVKVLYAEDDSTLNLALTHVTDRKDNIKVEDHSKNIMDDVMNGTAANDSINSTKVEKVDEINEDMKRENINRNQRHLEKIILQT